MLAVMSEKNLNTKKRGTIYELDLTLYSTSYIIGTSRIMNDYFL